MKFKAVSLYLRILRSIWYFGPLDLLKNDYIISALTKIGIKCRLNKVLEPPRKTHPIKYCSHSVHIGNKEKHKQELVFALS